MQVVSSRAFAGAFEAQDGTKAVWKFCAPFLDMLDHGGLCQLPGEEPLRLDNVRSAQMPIPQTCSGHHSRCTHDDHLDRILRPGVAVHRPN